MSLELRSSLCDHDALLTVLSCETAPNYFLSSENDTTENISVSCISEHASGLTRCSMRKAFQETASSYLLFVAKIHIAENSYAF